MADEIKRVYSEGAMLTCPDLATVGDIDSAMINLRFSRGGIGSIEAARNCGYGYDIRCEIRGTKGTLRVGYLRDTPVVALNEAGATHDIVPWFADRFTSACGAQSDHFVNCVRDGVEPSVGAGDARAALAVSLAATRSHCDGRPVRVADAER